MVLESGQKCPCGGEVDKLYLLDTGKLPVWQSRCFQCGEKHTVVSGE